MGIHVCLIRADGTEVPPEIWDWSRHAGDRELPSILRAVGEVSLPSVGGWDTPTRPRDVPTLREALARANGEVNEERWDTLCRTLTEEPGTGIYFSF